MLEPSRGPRELPAALALLPLLWVAGAAEAAPVQSLRSPDRRLEVRIDAGDRLRYSVLLRDHVLVQDATLSLDVDKTTLGLQPKVKAAKATTVDQTIAPVVRQKSANLREHYNQLRLDFAGGYAVVFRAYDEGVAYRFETSLPRAEVKVQGEEVGLNFAGDYGVYYPKEESFFSHNEREFVHLALSAIAPAELASLPAVVEGPGGVKIAIAESDVEDYPGLWLKGKSGHGLAGTFPPYPLKEELTRDRDFKVTQAADYIAVTKGTRTYPWRILGISEKDGDLITNALVYLLQKPSSLTDTSWIKPGKVAWDWWNANNIYGVGFKSGVNTRTYKFFIDFASRYGLEYVILDEGWYPLGDLQHVAPEIDMEELTAYARQKNVGLILWVVWKTLDDQLVPTLDQFEKWGIKGIKVDFMQRDDQPVVAFYHKVCREAAKRKMLVDFHGAIRPAAMTRTWPNLISTEGVRGLEQSKWSELANPEHDLALPFTRMFLGPMDYTPGAMVNATKRGFARIFDRPMSLGTRCHQLAMYVVFESPLQMLADSPSNYLREPDAMEFLGPVPSVWDETRVLDARLGDYVVMARRKGREWYVGAMTDWTAREIEIDLGFLPEGNFRLEAYADGVNADRYGSDYRRIAGPASRTSKLKLSLAEGGGYAARLVPVADAVKE
jgi:alpha-glucosidase